MKISKIIFRIILILVILEIGLRLSGYMHLSIQDWKNQISNLDNNTMVVMTVGDSISFTGDNPWPRQLESILNNKSQNKIKLFQ